MANQFYNPYSATPDYASGLSSAGNNIGMMLLLKKLMGEQGGNGMQGQVADPQAPMGTPMNTGPQGVPSMGGMNPPGAANPMGGMAGASAGMSGGPGSSMGAGAGMNGIDPGVLQKIQQLMGLLKMQGMPGQGGRQF